MSYADYQKLTRKPVSALDLLHGLDCPDVADVALEIPHYSTAQRQPVDWGIDSMYLLDTDALVAVGMGGRMGISVNVLTRGALLGLIRANCGLLRLE